MKFFYGWLGSFIDLNGDSDAQSDNTSQCGCNCLGMSVVVLLGTCAFLLYSDFKQRHVPSEAFKNSTDDGGDLTNITVENNNSSFEKVAANSSSDIDHFMASEPGNSY